MAKIYFRKDIEIILPQAALYCSKCYHEGEHGQCTIKECPCTIADCEKKWKNHRIDYIHRHEQGVYDG